MAEEPAQKSARDGMFTSLKHRDFSVLVFFGLPGLIGSVALTTAIFWVIKLLNGPNVWVGAINLARFLPPFFLVFFAGFMADRLDRRKIIVICELATAAVVLLLGLAMSFEFDSDAILLITVTGIGIASGINSPSWQTLYQDVVPPRDLLNAYSLSQAQTDLARIAGPALAMILLYALFPEGVCYFYAVGCLLTAAGILLMKTRTPGHHQGLSGAGGQLKSGARYFFGQKWMVSLAVVAGVNGFFGLSVPVLLPAMAKDVLKSGGGTYGLLVTLFAVGGVAAAYWVTRLKQRHTEVVVVRISLLSAGIVMGLYGFFHSYFLSCVFVFLLGCAISGTAVSINTVLLGACDKAMRGRVSGLVTMVISGAVSLGGMFMGAVADAKSAPAALVIGGIVSVATALVLSSFPKLVEGATLPEVSPEEHHPDPLAAHQDTSLLT